MKAFVEFESKIFNTKSSSHVEFKARLIPYGACFHFIGLFCYKALTVNAAKNAV